MTGGRETEGQTKLHLTDTKTKNDLNAQTVRFIDKGTNRRKEIE